MDRNDPLISLDGLVRVDMADPASIGAAVTQLPARIDGLVNAAGISGLADRDLVVRVNYPGLRHLTEALVPRLTGAALAAPLIATRARGQGPDVFRIGYIGPQSGPLGIFGAHDGWLIETLRTNLAGGIEVGGRRMQVEIVTADTQSDPVRASQITRDMINSAAPDLILTHSAPETVNPVSDAREAGATPCPSTVARWEAFYFGRGGRRRSGVWRSG